MMSFVAATDRTFCNGTDLWCVYYHEAILQDGVHLSIVSLNSEVNENILLLAEKNKLKKGR